MRFSRPGFKRTSSLASLLAISAAMFAGCDSGPSQTEVTKAQETRAQAIAEADKADSAIEAKNRRGGKKQAGEVKSIKGRLGAGKSGSE